MKIDGNQLVGKVKGKQEVCKTNEIGQPRWMENGNNEEDERQGKKKMWKENSRWKKKLVKEKIVKNRT